MTIVVKLSKWLSICSSDRQNKKACRRLVGKTSMKQLIRTPKRTEKTNWGFEMTFHAFLTSEQDGELVIFTLRAIPPRKESPKHRRRGGPQRQYGQDVEMKNPYLCWKSNPVGTIHSKSLHRHSPGLSSVKPICDDNLLCTVYITLIFQ
jgi:hypothetical protein